MTPAGRLSAIVGLAVAQLRHDRTRTALAVLGVTLAVLSTTVLAGTGIGVIETGEKKFDSAGRDLWVTGGAVRFAPTQAGGIQNSIYGSHNLSAELRGRDSIRTVGPLLFQTVYVSTDGEDFETIAAMGLPSSNGVSVSAGRGFNDSRHYAGGAYDGPMTHEILIDERTAALLDVGVGDTIHVGGTIATARQNEFEIVGVSGTGSRFLGAPTVTMPLSELQEITGKTASDPATIIALTLEDGADAEEVDRNLQRAYPELTIRTNREQLRATLERQAVILAGGASLVVLAVLAGLALTLNVLLSMVYQQLPEYAALKALGGSGGTLTGVVLVQAAIVSALGALLGLGAAFPVASALNVVAIEITGFENVVRITSRVLILGGGVAAAMCLLSGVVAGWRLLRLDSIRILR